MRLAHRLIERRERKDDRHSERKRDRERERKERESDIQKTERLNNVIGTWVTRHAA